MPKILIILSAADQWTLKDGAKHPTGFWAEEFAVPHQAFREAGFEVAVATPGGVRPTVDEVSLRPDQNGGDQAKVDRLRHYLASPAVAAELSAPLRLAGLSAADYDAVFLPGGHGPMEDLAVDPDLGRLLTEALDRDLVISALCHGPAGLLSATRPDGAWAFAGRRITAFSDEEERQAGLAENAPWLLESRLRERGGELVTGPAWGPHLIVDGNLITAQNPASSALAAQAVLDNLTKENR